MSYNKTNWTKGDVITAQKLNKMESGIENANGGGSGGQEEVEQYYGIEIDTDTNNTIVNDISDVVEACEKGIPCAVVEDGKIVNYLGVGYVGYYNENVVKITFVSFPELDTVYGGGTGLLVMGTKILPNKSISFTMKSITFT